ncbi:expressed unknown protein [Seminavis robusta]|uniref:Uncharacterized protein n=1 Tax=Seminavis robusta TaxID=568900 RepID=A0A9N8HJI8_9STRA|nr:expressed unknown protein [Seminavis robusta]|eukprot:Sro665_g183840.1 n/a (330) ;mRNA; f:25015-26004
MVDMFELPTKGTGCCNNGGDPNTISDSEHDAISAEIGSIIKGFALPDDSSVDILNADKPGEVTTETPTPLYNFIQKQKWESVVTFLETGKFTDFGFFGLGANGPDSPDQGKQAATWVTTKDWWGTITSQRLPIHFAIIQGAPMKVAYKLLAANPNGIRSTDADGNLPLHLSFKHKAAEDVIAFLLKAFPEAVSVKNNDGQRPVDFAEVDAGDIIQMCVDQTNREGKKEEARLCKALESEKNRLQEILDQLSEIRGELDHLRKLKTDSMDILARDNKKKVPEKFVNTDMASGTGVEVVTTSQQKKKGVINGKFKLKWMRKRVDANDVRAE